MRIAGWLSMLVLLLPGSVSLAQAPFYPAAPYGYPGYPMLPYGPPPPLMPYGYPPPLPPYGAPMPNGAKGGPSEPYFVPRDDPAVKRAGPEIPATPQPIEQAGLGSGARGERTQLPLPRAELGPPCEPYTLYEGKRYPAEVKQDDTHIWVQANFIHWWTRRDSVPPLVTNGDPTNRQVGTLGQPDTVILLGNEAIGPNEFTGIQANLGMWLDDERVQSLELGGFWVGKVGRQYSLGSDATGSPPLSQPILSAGDERHLKIAFPDLFAGRFDVSTIMDFYGAELNFARNTFRLDHWTLDLFAGLRYLYLHDALTMDQNIKVLPGPFGGNFIPFNNVPQFAGSTFLFNDSFAATNRFYGGQLGARVNFTYHQFDLGAVMKLGLGATTHVFNIDGSTTLHDVNGNTATASGSTLAQASNIGRYTSTDTSFVPELVATAGYQLTPHLRITAGYNLLYWTKIQRAGNQIDRQIDFIQVPTADNFVPGSVGTSPRFPNARTDFWAMGLNVGLELKY